MILKFIKNFLLIVIKSAVAVCLFVVSWQYLSPYFREEHNEDGDMFRNLPENTIDVLALGSSHMQFSFDPGVLYAESGYYGYVMGSSCQPIESSYYMLDEVLKTQSPEVVMVDVFTLLPQSQVCYAEGMYYKAIDMMTDETRIQAGLNIPNVEDETRKNYAFDLIMNHDNWRTMDTEDWDAIKEKSIPTEELNWIMGFVRQEPYDYRFAELETYEVTEIVTLSEDEQYWIDRLIERCDQEGIHLVFVKTPYVIDQESTNKLDAIWTYLDRQNTPYLDYVNNATEIGWYNLIHGDAWHNNSWGAEIVTRHFAAYIKDNNLVTHHKEEETMQMLVESAQWLSVRSLMAENNIDIYDMLRYAKTYPGAIAIRYKGRSYTRITDAENELLQSFGMTKDFKTEAWKDYYAFIVNGVVVMESDTPFSYTYNGREFTMDTNEILVDGETYYGHLGDMEFYFMDEQISLINPIGINYTQSFWKVGCDGWACSY